MTGYIDTGISDYHRLVYTVLKSTFLKLPPKEVVYRCYKNFSESNFLAELSRCLNSYPREMVNYDIFESSFLTVLDMHAPWKTKIIRGNEKPHMNKTLKKAIMKRSKLWNAYYNSKSLSNLLAYREQRNLVTKLNKRIKKLYFQTTIQHSKGRPKDFWNLCKPFMSNKGFSDTRIVLSGPEDSIIQDECEISKVLNNYFNNITKPLNLFEWNCGYPTFDSNQVMSVAKCILKYENHPSILKIRSNHSGTVGFTFKNVTSSEVYKMILKLDCSKKTSGSISNKILISSANVICPFITNIINSSIVDCVFPDKLKLAEITPVPKVEDSKKVGDSRPISILPAIPKLFEKVLANQLSSYFDTIFCNLLCGFRKRHSTQHALIQLLSSWQRSLDKGEIVGTILMDLSKAFDCLPHDLIIAKCAAYGVDLKSLCLLKDYLSNRYHRVKIGNVFSDWLLLVTGVPQGSILGPLLFNIFINDSFQFVKEASVCNFADDDTLYAHAKTLLQVLHTLELETVNLLEWFKINSIAANPENFQLMLLGNIGKIDNIKIKVNDKILEPKSCVKLLGMNIDCKLNFAEHVKTLCKSASNKVKALFRMRPYLDINSAKKLSETFILSTFNYCPLIWMYGCKTNNAQINKVHTKALRAVYFDFSSTFDALLEKDASVSIHVKNLRFLLIEIYKILNRESPSFLWDIFETKPSAYALRSGDGLVLPSSRTQTYGVNSLAFRGSLLWNSLTPTLKNIESSKLFKTKIKSWSGGNCTCKICS